MRLHALIPTVCLTIAIAACQAGGPIAPPDDSGDPGDLAALPAPPADIDEGPVNLPEDAVDEGTRGLTALLNGDLDLLGSVTTPVGYQPSPVSVTQPATTGEIALIRLRATASDATTTRTLYSDVRGPGGAYSSMTFLSNDTSVYKAVYVIRNEDLSVRVHNRPSYSGTLNPPAADVNYTFETKAIEDSSEPNDDENAATVTDRSMSKTLGLGATATRSFYDFSASARDKEDWFSTTLTAGAQYRYRLNSYNPRYGTWGYTLKLLNSAGTQVGSTSTITVGNAVGSLFTPAIPTTGTYYIQIVGTPVTKSNNSNVFYSIYSLNVCQQAVAAPPVFTPSNGTGMCNGTTGEWNVAVSPAPASYSWNFGGGSSPSTSTLPSPEVTLTGNGTYLASLTTTSACGALFTKIFTYQVGCNWARTIGTPTARNEQAPFVTPSAVLVDGENRAHLVGTIVGTDVQCTAQEPIGTRVLLTPSGTWAMMYVVLNPDGSLQSARKLIEGNAGPSDIALTSDGDLRVIGRFAGNGLDFDPGPNAFLMSSPGTTDGFCQAISAAGDFQWAAEWGSSNYEYARGLELSSGDAIHIVGSFADTVDFDPGAGTQFRTSAGSNDAYWLTLLDSGAYSGVVTMGGVGGSASAEDIVKNTGTNYYITGYFSGTCDFNPGGTTTRTSAGSSDAYLAAYSSLGALQWVNAWGSTNGDVGNAVVTSASNNPIVAGKFQGAVDFDPGAGTVSRNSTTAGYTDCYLAQYTSAAGTFQWVNTWGGATEDLVTDLVVASADGKLAVYGTFSSTADFDGGANATNRTAVGLRDIYLAVLNSDGAFNRVSTWGTTLDEYSTKVAAGTGRLHPVGYYQRVMDFNPGAGTSNITPRGLYDGFAMRLNEDGTW